MDLNCNRDLKTALIASLSPFQTGTNRIGLLLGQDGHLYSVGSTGLNSAGMNKDGFGLPRVDILVKRTDLSWIS